MAWIKSHQVLSYFLFSLVAFCLSFLLAPSLSCSAVSQSFTYDSTNMPYNRDFTAQDVGFSFNYVTFVVEKTGSTGRTSNVFCFYWAPGATQCNSLYFTSGSSFLSMYVPDSTVYIGSNASNFTSLIITFTDTLPTEQDCPDCPDCPEVPDTPYGDKLDKIYHAILIGSATMLVIYFFFIMFKWYLGGQ